MRSVFQQDERGVSPSGGTATPRSRASASSSQGTSRSVALLVDECDAPVMSGHANGYYARAVSFLKSWLTGAVKSGGESVAVSCFTGVQRVAKESVFSDLDSLVVDTPLTARFDKRSGFTEAEVTALVHHLFTCLFKLNK
ncbi:AAA family ATPase [bacterium]|nr:AAA family ATPase [bacterium]